NGNGNGNGNGNDRERPQKKQLKSGPSYTSNQLPPKKGPIKSLRNQEKERELAAKQPPAKHRPPPTPPANANDKKRKAPQQPPKKELKIIKKSKVSETDGNDGSANPTNHAKGKDKGRDKAPSTSKSKSKPKSRAREEYANTEPPKMKLNPFTGEMEAASRSTALEKLLAKAEAGPSASSSSSSRTFGPKKSRKKMSQQEKEEEDEIRWLEYQLGKKGSTKGPDGEEIRDELDDFLDDLDRFQAEEEEEESDSDSDETEDDDDDDDEDEDGEEADEDLELDLDENENEDEGEDAEKPEGASTGDEADSAIDEGDINWDAAMATTDEEAEAEDEDDASDNDSGDEEEYDSEMEEAMELMRDFADSKKAGVESSASAPAPASATAPASTLRAKLAAEASGGAGEAARPSAAAAAAALDDLRRQAQGLLNRLGDGNIDSIVSEFEALYRTYARAHLVLDTVTNLVDTFVILHAAFVAAMHKVVGVEFAAAFVSSLLLDEYRLLTGSGSADRDKDQDQDQESSRGKECLNLTVLACELYNLQVVACPLIYDLIRMFLGQTSPDSAAAVSSSSSSSNAVGELQTIRCCGHQLKHDDSTSLKAIIALTTSRVSSTSTRSKFMLERMAELQKGSVRSGAGVGSRSAFNEASDPTSPSGSLLARMKKYLGAMANKRSVRSYEPLRISKGKWWLVGAAWTGQTDQSDAQGLTKASAIQSSSLSLSKAGEGAGSEETQMQQAKLLELARAQGMNTDARRSVFITLVSAEDYKQALLMLKLNDVQRREVIRVLIHCLGSESVYNPFYTLIGQELCIHDHSMRITLQYYLGQHEVAGAKFAQKFSSSSAAASADSQSEHKENVDPRRIANLARAYSWWISRGALSLQALKVVDFSAVRPTPAKFLGLLMIHLSSSPSPSSSSSSSSSSLSSLKGSPAKTLHLPTLTRQPLQTSKLHHLISTNLVASQNQDLPKGLLFFLNTNLDQLQTAARSGRWRNPDDSGGHSVACTAPEFGAA
ncbi:LOW QUALITY PROTEIN: hypothetical protein BCV70DRAFT_203243, partial [Testicularia cyperi]